MGDEILAEVIDLLYAGGGDELIAKMNPAQSDLATSKKKQRERTQARVGLASNVVGIAAGTAGLHEAAQGLKATRYKKRTGKDLPEKKPKTEFGRKFKRFKGKYAVPLAAGAVGLQGANLAGDAIANRVLARSAKEEPNVKGGAPTAVRVARKKTGEGVDLAREQTKKTFGKGLLQLVEKRDDEIDVTWDGEIAKADEDKQQIFGWASVVEVNGEPVVDLQGDLISPEEMEKAGYSYVMKSRKGGDMHLRDEWSPVQKSEMIESFIVTPEKRDAMGLPDSVPSGWWVGFQVQDPDVWAKVKSGERTGFSIHGHGKRTPAST